MFVQISTDEVYGDIREEQFFETDTLSPSNPYSASKAAAEMFVYGYNKTFGIDYLVTRSSNNYGERQYVEKLIPKIIDSVENGVKIPIHGDGSYVRDWIYVKDNVRAIYHLISKGYKNDIYNIAANNHMTNLEVVESICNWYDIDDQVHVQGAILGSSELTLKIDGVVAINHESTSTFSTSHTEDLVYFDDKNIYVKSMNEEQGQFMFIEFEADNNFDISKLVLSCDRVGYGKDDIEFDCYVTGVEYDGEDLGYIFENDVTTKSFSIELFNPYYEEEQDI